MALLARLLFAAMCCHLSAQMLTSECENFIIWHESNVLDVEGSENATISVIALLDSYSKEDCSKKCCRTDKCAVATFDAAKNGTCQHFACFPIEECHLISSTSSQIWTFLVDGSNTTTSNWTLTTPSHGDGTHSKPRKGVLPDEPLLDEEPLKHDNTSVKPRKGVGDDPTPLLPSVMTPTSVFTYPTSILSVEDNETIAVTSTSSFVNSLSLLPSVMDPPLHSHGKTDAALNPKVPLAEKAEVRELGSSAEAKLSSSSLHIVIALVLGLMVLLGVFGVIGKRVYDQWQRRHYHRMDFLVDGMYDGR